MLTHYVYYSIWFADKTEYNAAVALVGGNLINTCPFNAATIFGITWPLVGGGPITGTKGMLNAGSWINIGFPSPSGVDLLNTINSVVVPGQVGNLPGIWPKGPDCLFIWTGVINYSANEVAGAPPVTPIPQRRWIAGFEHTGADHELGTGYANFGGRVGSRTMDGFGLTISGNNTSGSWSHSVDTYRPGLTPKKSWERIYIRVRQPPTSANQRFWRFHTTINGVNGGTLGITTSGEIIMENLAGTGVYTTLGTTAPLALNTWYKLDILLNLPTVAGDTGRLRLYVNGSLAIDGTSTSGQGIDFISTHTYTEVASYTGDADVILDIDDWMGADIPELLGVESLDSIDWLYGTHIRASNMVSGSMGTWTGSIGFTNQYNDPESVVNQIPISTTALDTVEGLSDIQEEERFFPFATIGIASIAAGVSCKSASASTCRVGYKLAGGATVWVNASLNATIGWKYNYYNPSGLTMPFLADPYSILFEKANNAISTELYAMSGLVEYVGVFGIEDDATLPVDPTNTVNLHNARFANSYFGLPEYGPVIAPVYAVGGTYTGNGLTQDINLPGPVSFVWIRATSGSPTSGVNYIGPHSTVHAGVQQRGATGWLVRVWMDDTGQYKFTVTGNNLASNQNTVVYQYIAFSDPGGRFNLTGAYNPPNSYTAFNVLTWLTDFNVAALITARDYLQDNTSTIQFRYKGPGQTGSDGCNLDGSGASSTFGILGLGGFTAEAFNIANIRSQITYSAWRETDCAGYGLVQIGSYIGDGLGARTINFPSITDRYPLFALVVARGGTSYFRDPSHTGNNSQSIGLVTSTTAITGGGKGYINVGVSLNSLGVIYELFVILGDTAGWNNGTFAPPVTICQTTWERPSGGGDPIIVMDGGLNFNGDAPYLALEDASGIYTLVPEKRNDTIYPKSDNTTVDVAIPEPFFKTGYIGG